MTEKYEELQDMIDTSGVEVSDMSILLRVVEIWHNAIIQQRETAAEVKLLENLYEKVNGFEGFVKEILTEEMQKRTIDDLANPTESDDTHA